MTLFGNHPLLRKIFLALLMLAGFGVRMLYLTNPPLDIHPTRQLHSALMARGLYYDHITDEPEWKIRTAIIQGKREPVIEPPIMETTTAWLYGVTGGENVWIARILSSLFWVLAGLAFYSLAVRLSNPDGGLISLGIYLFLPYAVSASRTFQPDPLMVSLIVAAWWGFMHWQDRPTLARTLLAGLLAGLAIFVKNVSAYFLAIPFLVVLLQQPIIKIFRSWQNWVFGVLAILPAAAYTIYGTYIDPFLTQQFNFRIFPELWITPANYSRWFMTVTSTLGLPCLLLSLLGLFLIKDNRNLRFILGCWAGYLLYGMTFAYHIGTHDYYQLPFLPMAILSIAPVGSLITATWLEKNRWKYHRQVLAGVLVVAALGGFWVNRLNLQSQDYTAEVAFWQEMGERLRGVSVLGLTEDYGYRMSFFGWNNIDNWSGSGDLAVRDLAGRPKDPLEMLAKSLDGKRYFLVTWLEDFDRQTEVKDYFFSHYEYEQGTRYILFDLSKPLQ